MKITVENKEIINPKSISVHDGIIEKFEYHYTERICNIEILNDCWNIRQTFCIKNIILMYQQNCEFWGCSPHVHCWCYDKKQPFLKQLWIKQKSDKQFRFSLLEENPDIYFEHYFQFISGNEILFICEEVEFYQYPYFKDKEV